MAPKDQSSNSQDQPPSSFPGIWKYPSFREIPFRNADDWIAGKRKDDAIGNLWRVHNKLYDLTPFMPNHPGGSEWLEITQGTDITEAFETSHVVNVQLVETTLAKYFVLEAKEPRLSPYTFEPDGFYKTLKRRIEPILKKVGQRPTRKMVLLEDVTVATFMLLGILGTWYDSNILRIMSGTILAWTLIGAHNFGHLRSNWRKYYYDIGLLSSYEWRITHALSHHLYPNTLMDYELFMYPTFEFLPNRSKTWLTKYGPPMSSHFLYLVAFWIDFTKRIYNLIKGTQKWRHEYAIVVLELGFLLVIAPSVQNGIWSWILIHSVASFVFLTIAANGSHHHPEIFHDGDEARPSPDFGLCQLDATRERAGDFYKNTWITLVTFGEHSLHHLFPTICHSKLPELRPVFEQTLKDFSESFPPIFQWELYLGCFQQLARTETNKFPYIKDKKKN